MSIRTLYALPLLALAAQISAAVDAGTAVADITPDVQRYTVPMAGYGAREGQPATGIHDPLHAKVLYLRDGDTAMALITCDLRSVTPGFKDQILAKTGDLGLTRDNTMLAASHTHAGPSIYAEEFWQLQFGVYDPAIVEMMSTAIAEAVEEAANRAAPVQIGFGHVQAEGFTRNRRWGYDQEAREAAGETPALDPALSVLRVDNLEGSPVAILVHFATHPTILGHENMELTAEWPGVLQRRLEEAYPGATVLYANGAEGDQSPAGAAGADGFEKIDDFGARLAQVARTAIDGITTSDGATIAYHRRTPALLPLKFTKVAHKRYGEYLEVAKKDLPRHAEIQVFRIGSLALAALPGEPILEVGQSVERAVAEHGFEQVVTIGLANDYIGYIVNEKEYAHGGYEVDSRSYYGPGLGAFIAEQAGLTAEDLGSP